MRRYGAPPIALCAFEDDLILGSTTLRSVRNKAITLRVRSEHARTQVPEQAETQFTPWVKAESFTLAKAEGYRNSTLQSSPTTPEYLVETTLRCLDWCAKQVGTDGSSLRTWLEMDICALGKR